MHIVAFNGSPRRNGNTSLMLAELLRGVRDGGGEAREFVAQDLNLKNCIGCLRCNIIKRCALPGDDWSDVSRQILSADALIFATPVYFHHLPAPLKKIIDRFRSFIHVQITPESIRHTPWTPWNKRFVLLLCMGSSDSADARPVIDLFSFMTGILGPENTLQILSGTRLAVAGQVARSAEELAGLYGKLGLPAVLAEEDYRQNRNLLQSCYDAGRALTATDSAGKRGA
jgi:NAD(P)H-dependent FMN reductase